ncbi:hypothetical protein Ancab_024329 [Ancistrocladus abbreviatus]
MEHIAHEALIIQKALAEACRGKRTSEATRYYQITKPSSPGSLPAPSLLLPAPESRRPKPLSSYIYKHSTPHSSIYSAHCLADLSPISLFVASFRDQGFDDMICWGGLLVSVIDNRVVSMTFDMLKKLLWILLCDSRLVKRHRLWGSWKILFDRI